jgi:DNA-binding transcriptional regulator YbjK
MARAKRQGQFQPKMFLESLRNTLSTLPSTSEKQEIQETLTQLMDYLANLQRTFHQLPTIEDTTEVTNAIKRLQELFAHAEANPILAHVLGLQRSSTAERKKPVTSEEETATARTMLKDFESLSIDEVRTKLEDETFPLSELRTMALLTDMSDVESLNREALVHQMVTKIANFRGDQRLGEP